MLDNLLKISSLVTLISLSLPIGGCTKDLEIGRSFPSPLDAAQNSLNEMRALQQSESDVGSESLKDQENDYAKVLGFSSANDFKSAQLGSSLRLYRVDSIMLEDYQKGTDPNLLLVDTRNQIFPLIANGQPRSLLTVIQGGDGSNQMWKESSVGSDRLATMISQYRQPRANMLVELSKGSSKGSLNIRFLGYQKVMLIPLTDHPDLGLVAGKEIDAEALFDKLAPLASSINKAQSAESPYTDTRKRPRIKKDVR